VKVFADTSYFIALLNGRDEAHDVAVAFSREDIPEVFLTEFVLMELGDGFCKPSDRPDFLTVVEYVRTNPHYIVVPCSPALLAKGLDLFASRPDKEWSLTDCTSFVIMREENIADALTTDRHFIQGGFRALLLPD
jgi:hypothetical protein